jgi:hypothetical protein
MRVSLRGDGEGALVIVIRSDVLLRLVPADSAFNLF